MSNVDAYYSKPLCTPDGIYRNFYLAVPAGCDPGEDSEVLRHLDRNEEVEINLGAFSPKALICVIGKP